MSVIVTGIDMSKSCASCDFYVGQVGNVYCKFTRRKVGTTVACYEIMKDCPLKSVDGLIEKLNECADDKSTGEQVGIDLAIDVIKEYCGMEDAE